MDIREILYDYVPEEIGRVIYSDFEKYFNSKSQKEQVLFYFKLEPQLTNKDINEIFVDWEINTLTRRLYNSNYIENVDKEGKAYIYSITTKGLDYLQRKINAFLNNNFDYKEYLSKKRKEKLENSNMQSHIKTLLQSIIDLNIIPNDEDKIVIDMKELCEHNYEAAEVVYGNIIDSLFVIKDHFKYEIEDMKDENIVLKNIHENIFQPIHHIDRESKELIFTKGLVTSKKENIVSKTLFTKFSCTNPSCDKNTNHIKTNSGLKLKSCPKCKSNLEIIHEEKINKLESKITDVESGISFHLELQGKLATDFSYIELGDEIEVIGYLQDKIIEEKDGNKESIKIIVVNNFNKTDYIKELTKEELEEVDKILNKYGDNIKQYLLSPFKNYIEEDFIKEIIIAQQLSKYSEEENETPLNISIMGEPGVGKNELIKLAERYFPTCDSIVGADITDAGFKGTVNRDTGIKEVGLAKKCQHGTLFFNEFDKFIKTNPNGKKGGSQLLNASITEQEIRLNKAGIRIRMRNLDLRHNIMFNPLETKILYKDDKYEKLIRYNLMSEIMDKSLLSRMIPIYIGKDKSRSRKVFDVMLKNNKNKLNINEETYKLVIKYLRNKQVIFTTGAENALKKIYENILNKDILEVISVERIGLMLIQLCKAVTRLNNLDKCTNELVKYSFNLYTKALSTVDINYENMDQLFLEKPIEEIKTIHEIKLYIKKEFDDKELKYIKISDLQTLFDSKMLKIAIEELKKEGDYFEPIKDQLRKI